MVQIRLAVFGGFAMFVGDQEVARFPTDKVRALLTYLALEGGQPQRREKLAVLFWPEASPESALKNLRQSLYRLRQTLERTAPGATDALLQADAQTVALDSTVLTVDVLRFQAALLAAERHPHAALAACPDCLARIGQAVDSYHGELLAGFGVGDAPAFEEWLLIRRETLHHQALLALGSLALAYEERGELEEAHRYAARQLALDPYREEAHRQLIRLLAMRGLVQQALAQYEACRRLLREGLDVDPAAETVALVEWIRTGKFDEVTGWQAHRVTGGQGDRAAPPHPVTAGFPNNLPANLAHLVGRDEQLAQIVRTVLDPAQPLVTLVGMGGIGKTRLALAVIERMVVERPVAFPHGAWFAPLIKVEADLPDLSQALAEAILKAFGTAVAGPIGGPGHAQAQLFHHLAGRQLLLVLDNFEHLLANERSATLATTFLLALRQAAPGVTVLVTSRTPLHIAPEQIIWLKGLPVPGPKAPAAASFASIRLFVQQAQRMLPTFTVEEETLADVVEICQLVNGMPLGIELAATLAPHFTAAEIVAAIRQNLSILVSTRRDLDERHRRLTAVFEYSWQLLSAQEQRILAQSSIFVGRFSRAAAQAITGATPLDLIGLVDKSLLHQPAVSRYELHELLRQFAAEKLAALDGEVTAALQARYAQHYLGFVAERAGQFRRRNNQALVAQIYQESENIRRAWEVALASQSSDLLSRALDGLLHYWQATGRYHEGEALLVASLPAFAPSAVQQDAPRAVQLFVVKLWLAYADCLSGQGVYKAALDAAEKALALAEMYGDEIQIARGLMAVAEAAGWLGNYAKSHLYAQRAHDLAQQHQLWAVEARALLQLSRNAATQAQELALLAQALQIAQAHDDPYLELVCTQFMAGVYANAGWYDRAVPYRAQGLQLASAIQDRYQIADAHYHYAHVHLHLGAYDTALAHFQQALTIAQEQGFRWLEKLTLNHCAALYCALGKLDTAHELSAQARTPIGKDHEQPLLFAYVYGRILAAQGRWTESDRVYQEVLAKKRTRAGMQATRLLPELASLAHNAWRQDALPQALCYVDEIIEILDTHPRFSANDVDFDLHAIHLACYQVLNAAGDPRAADILAAGYQALSTYAETIADADLRRAYLEHVPAHRDLVAAWQAAHPPST